MSGVLILPLVLVQVFSTSASGFIIEKMDRILPSIVVGFALWLAGQAAQTIFGRNTSVGTIVGILLVQGLGVGATIQSEWTLWLDFLSGYSCGRSHRQSGVSPGIRSSHRQSGSHWNKKVRIHSLPTSRTPIDLLRLTFLAVSHERAEAHSVWQHPTRSSTTSSRKTCPQTSQTTCARASWIA